MGSARALTTWGKHGKFSYVGSPALGTKLVLGLGRSAVISKETWADLLAHFRGKTVAIGASRNPPRDSLGGWLRSRVGLPVAAAYVGPILVEEGLATRVSPSEVAFHDA